MNTDEVTLPALSDARVEEMETALFSQIATERRDERARLERERVRAVRRGRWWMGGAAAAAVVAVAAIIAPQVLSGIPGPSGFAGSADSAAVAPASGGEMGGAPLTDASGGAARTEAGASDTEREIAVSASATVEVDDAAEAATSIGEAAVLAGGYVETMSIGSSTPVDPLATTDMYAPLPTGTWITVRVPSDQLTATLSGLGELGTLTASQIDRRDVTTEAVDLRARVAALEGSVARLTELLAESASTADLIAAESALSQRQSDLDSLRQQLTWLEGQVDMASVMITLVEPAPAVTADPAGFGDGVAAGWSGLVATLNGIVIAIGFLLPWLAVAAVAGTLIWAVRRVVRARRSSAPKHTAAED